MDNAEKLATFGTEDTVRRQAKQKPQHRKLKRRATRTPPKTGGTQAPPKTGGTQAPTNGNHFLHLIRHLPYNSYSKYVLDTTIRKQTQITKTRQT
jgi:hypothetical protein